jgi:tetratricopeptide (TPR) repeat protein
MLKIHLAQIFFNPAYYDPPVNFLEEPFFLNETAKPLGSLRSGSEISTFLEASKQSYIAHIRAKILDIVQFSASRMARIVTFPEYSVPYQLLPDLARLAIEHSLLIIAGTHRIPGDEEAKMIYQSLGINSIDVTQGSACSPIIFPDGTVILSPKLKRSKWEANLIIPNGAQPKTFAFRVDDKEVRFAVIPCIDSLHPEILGDLWRRQVHPSLILCPSLSPSIELFHNAGSLVASKDALFGCANTASFGGSFFQIAEASRPYLKGLAGRVDEIPRGSEAVFEIEIDPERLFLKRGSIESAPISTHPIAFPLVYQRSSTWLTEFNSFKSDVLEWLANSEPNYAIDWIDSFLADSAQLLPHLVAENLKYLRHAVIPLYDGNAELIRDLTNTVLITGVKATPLIWARRIEAALTILGRILLEPDSQSLDNLLECLRTLKNGQQMYPVPPGPEDDTSEPVSEASMFVGEDDLVQAFQNRGPELDEIRGFLSNPDNRIILITGPVGIGKTDFTNLVFRKSIIDWKLIRIRIPTDGTVARILADIAYNLKLTLDVDSLAAASHHVFRQKVRNLLRVFYSTTKRALVIDDLQQILVQRNARDYRQLNILIEEASRPPSFTGGRIFIVSSAWLPSKWFFSAGIAHIHLRDLNDRYIRRIVEYHLRRTENIGGESVPETPQALLDLIGGHPLSARLVVDAIRDKNLREFSDELLLSKITDHVAKALLSRIELPAEQEELLSRLSIFRLPVRRDQLLQSAGEVINPDVLEALMSLSIVGYDGRSFEMHEAVRRFYESKIGGADLRKKYHELAAVYYESLFHQRPGHRSDPSIVAELVHHLSLSGNIARAKELELLLVSEIKPAARELYRDYRDYTRALSLYRLLAELTPDDPQILAYVGRCYARLGLWTDSDDAFRKAIKTANRLGNEPWWIYRDWGHIKARFQYHEEAEDLLLQARDINPDDPSISASLAYMTWHQGDLEEARRLFEDAYERSPNNPYILTFYPRLLDDLGEHEYARSLRRHLTELDEAREYREPQDYDIEDYAD